MTFRITPHRQLELSLAATRDHLSKSNSLQTQISSGVRIQRPSDDPEGQRTVLSQHNLVSRFETQLSSIEYARANLNQSNVELIEANRILAQSKTLALQARQATEQSELNLIADELDGYLSTLDTVANSRLNGRYLFSGTAVEQEPYPEVAANAVAYQGGRESAEVVLADESDIQIFLRGEDVFSFEDGHGKLQSVFETIRELRDTLRDRSTLDSEEWGQSVDSKIEELELASDHVLSFVGKQSVSLAQLDRIQTRTEDLKHEAEQLLSETNSPDFAKAITQLQEEQSLLQYSFATISRLFNLSILDYLG